MASQKRAVHYYNKFSKIYDWASPKWYYHNARKYTIAQLNLTENQTILNVPCGTGQNFAYFQTYLKNKGRIIGVDLSPGMLAKARQKCHRMSWSNVELHEQDVRELTSNWVGHEINSNPPMVIDAILCDLGLSGFPDWQMVIDQLIALLKPQDKIVILDWYMTTPSLRGRFVKWIGKGEIDRPIWQYLEGRVEQFHLKNTFNRGAVFVASGHKPPDS